MDREIKVTKCGEQKGCLFDDRVSIEFSPSELEALKNIFEQRAVNATRSSIVFSMIFANLSNVKFSLLLSGLIAARLTIAPTRERTIP